MGDCRLRSGARRAHAARASRCKLTSSEAALLQALRGQRGTLLLAHRSVRAPGRRAGTLDRRAGDAPAPQDRGRSQASALSANRARRGVCPCPRPRHLKACAGWRATIPARFVKALPAARTVLALAADHRHADACCLQAVVSYVFFERDLDSTTRWMARDIAADAAFLVALEDTHTPAERIALRTQASRMLAYPVIFLPGAQHQPAARHHRTSTIEQALDEVIAQQIVGGRNFEVTSADRNINIEHPGARRRAAHGGAAQPGDGFKSRYLHCLDGRLVADPDRGGDPVPAQPGAADRAAGAGVGGVRQGPRRAGLQTLWRDRSAPRRARLSSPCANASNAMCSSAPRCWRASVTT